MCTVKIRNLASKAKVLLETHHHEIILPFNIRAYKEVTQDNDCKRITESIR